MFKRLLILAAVSAAALPAAALAQQAAVQGPAVPTAAAEAAAPAPAAIPLAADPDQSHDPEKILFLDLSNGRRVAIRATIRLTMNAVAGTLTAVRGAGTFVTYCFKCPQAGRMMLIWRPPSGPSFTQADRT